MSIVGEYVFPRTFNIALVKTGREEKAGLEEDTRGGRERFEYDPNAARLVLLARSRGILSTCHLRTGLHRGNERASREIERVERKKEKAEKEQNRGPRAGEEKRPSDILRDRTFLGPLSMHA